MRPSSLKVAHTVTRMSNKQNLYRLMTWLSPSFPVGAYSFSHGLEAAVDSRLVHDMETTRCWIAEILSRGDGQSDLVFLAAAWRAAENENQLREVHELALAFQPTAEIQLESTAQGAAFIKAASAAWPCPGIDALKSVVDGPIVYSVAVGAVARSHGVEEEAVLQAYGHAFVANLVSAAIRLIPLGQTHGQKIIAALSDDVDTAVARALVTPLDLVSSSCIMVDVMSMRHEVQYTRLFRS